MMTVVPSRDLNLNLCRWIRVSPPLVRVREGGRTSLEFRVNVFFDRRTLLREIPFPLLFFLRGDDEAIACSGLGPDLRWELVALHCHPERPFTSNNVDVICIHNYRHPDLKVVTL